MNFTYNTANNRLRLLNFDSEKIALFNPERGTLIQITRNIKRILKNIERYETIDDLFRNLRISRRRRPSIRSELNRLTRLGFLERGSYHRRLCHDVRQIEEDDCVTPPVRSLILHVTSRCNLQCLHCYATAGMCENKKDTMSLRDISVLLQNFRNMGGLVVDITGGEPLLREDLFDILEISKKLRLRVRLLTNGVLLLRRKEEIIDLKDLVDKVTLSLDGLQDTHDWIRGKGNFDIVVSTIQHLVQDDFHVGVTTLITDRSLCQLEAMANLLVQLGVEKWSLTLPRLSGRTTKNRDLYANSLCNYFSEQKRGLDLMKKIYHIASDGKIQVMADFPMLPQETITSIDRSNDLLFDIYEKNRVCWDACLCVFSNGDLVPCLFYTDLVYGNIKKECLKRLYRGNARNNLLKSFKHYPKASCPHILERRWF